MPSIHETAYPRLKAAISNNDLEDLFTPIPTTKRKGLRVAKRGAQMA